MFSQTIGPWKLSKDGGCRSAVYHREAAGRSTSGMVIERKPWFGLEIAERRRHEIQCDLERNAEDLETLNDEALYDTGARPVTVVSQTAKTIVVTNSWQETFRIPVSKFKDGEAFHARYIFTWGSCRRGKLQASVANSKQWLARAEADCVKWQQRVQDDPDGWYAD